MYQIVVIIAMEPDKAFLIRLFFKKKLHFYEASGKAVSASSCRAFRVLLVFISWV